MPTTIAVESKPVEFQRLITSYQHLYLVKTTTDAQGRILSEKVIRGGADDDGRLAVIADVDLAATPDRRGSDTPLERHRRPLDVGDRDPNAVWAIMVEHARNIDEADLPYGFDILQQIPGPDVNSNTVVASALHTVGIALSQNFPIGITGSQAPLYDQVAAMAVDDLLHGTVRNDLINGGVGRDRIYGGRGNDKLAGEVGNDLLSGGFGNDHLIGGPGNDRLYGGHGIDILRGGTGLDAFVFNTMPNQVTNIDAIWDFVAHEDTVWLENSVFTALGAEGSLGSGAFWIGAAAHDGTDRIIYDPDRGRLYYDPDGTGAVEQIAFCKLDKDLQLSSANFLIV